VVRATASPEPGQAVFIARKLQAAGESFRRIRAIRWSSITRIVEVHCCLIKMILLHVFLHPHDSARDLVRHDNLKKLYQTRVSHAPSSRPRNFAYLGSMLGGAALDSLFWGLFGGLYFLALTTAGGRRSHVSLTYPAGTASIFNSTRSIEA
jgi:hypothetical protein